MVMLAAIGICYSYYHQMRAELDVARVEHERIAAEAAALEVENARIAAEVDALQHDPEAIEFAARRHLGMVRPGEVVLSAGQGVAN